jgi:hypothetical protein
MEGIFNMTAHGNSIRAILEGGPGSIPATSRVQMVSPFNDKIKVPHYNGYEHFERTSEPDGSNLFQEIVFRWTMRTKAAE